MRSTASSPSAPSPRPSPPRLPPPSRRPRRDVVPAPGATDTNGGILAADRAPRFPRPGLHRHPALRRPPRRAPRPARSPSSPPSPPNGRPHVGPAVPVSARGPSSGAPAPRRAASPVAGRQDRPRSGPRRPGRRRTDDPRQGPVTDPALARADGPELAAFEPANPRSRAPLDRARGSLLAGVPDELDGEVGRAATRSSWSRVGRPLPDVDGHEYVDFCLGDTGAMTGTPGGDRPGRRGPARGGSPTCSRPRTPSSSARSCSAGSACPTGSSPLGDRREPFRDPARRESPADRGPRLQLLLPRLGGRVVRDAGPDGGVDARPATSARPRDGRDDPRRGDQRPRGAGARACPGDVAAASSSPRSPMSASSFPSPGTTRRCASSPVAHGTLLLIDETHTICTGPGGYTGRTASSPTSSDRQASAAASRPGPTGSRRRSRTGSSAPIDPARTATWAGSAARSPATPCPWPPMRATLTEVLTDEAFAG